MGKTRAQLRYFGQWSDGPASTNQPAEFTVAARRMAATALDQLSRLGVAVELDQAGKPHFHAARIPPPGARLTIERQGDLIEAYLIERAIAASEGSGR
jgi:hypothetical protein